MYVRMSTFVKLIQKCHVVRPTPLLFHISMHLLTIATFILTIVICQIAEQLLDRRILISVCFFILFGENHEGVLRILEIGNSWIFHTGAPYTDIYWFEEYKYLCAFSYFLAKMMKNCSDCQRTCILGFLQTGA